MRHAAMLLALTLLAPATAGAGPNPGEDAADLVLAGGVFYPVEPAEPVRGSLAIRDGRIVYLGSAEGAAAWHGAETEVIDLAGRAVTPGLIDAHSHLGGLGRALESVDLVATRSYAEVVERIARAAAELPAGSWVTGRGWDQNDWPVKHFPSHRPLSREVPDHPVAVRRIDGHAMLLNERAMRELGLGPETTDPVGGRFVRNDQGELTGVLIDRAMDVVGAGVPEPSQEDRIRHLRVAADHCVERGLTTATDMGVSADDLAAYAAVTDSRAAPGPLPLRTAAFLTDDAELIADWLARGPRVDEGRRLIVRGIKLYADGALGSRGAALIEPYDDDPGNLGLLTATGAHLEDVARRALAAGFQVAIHAIGDRGNLVALDALQRALGEPRPEARFRIEHAQVMRLDDIERMARWGVIASVQPTHATSDMPWAGRRVGEQRLAGAYAWRKALDAGARLALGSDFPVESADPRLGLYAAVTRQDLDGAPEGGWLPGERLDRHEALAGFTLWAADSLFLADEVGSLTVGKRADLVVWGRDPMTVPAAQIPQAEIDLTLVDGEVVHRRQGAR